MSELLRRHISNEYDVQVGKSILYKIEVNALGKITPESVDAPSRGRYAFQTDILVERRAPAVPIVAIELKYGSFSAHDVITYSSKAVRHKEIYPYLRYGFIVVGAAALARRFVTHNQGFDFAMAVPDLASKASDVIALVRRQIESAERLSTFMRSDRTQFSRYEEIVETGI